MIALGVLHIGFTFHDHDSFSLEALWFAAAGVAIVLAGFLNVPLVRTDGRDAVIRSMCVAANVVLATMFAATAAWLMWQPQVFVGLMLFAAAAVFSATHRARPDDVVRDRS